MSAVAKLRATKQPPFQLKPSPLFEDCPTIAVCNQVQVHPASGNGNPVNQNRKQVLPFCPDSSDKERLVCCFNEFLDACDPELLNLKDEKLHLKAREILGGDLKTTWIEVMTEAKSKDAANVETAHCKENVRKFLSKCVPPNAFHVLREFLTHVKKPFSIDCFDLASRLRLINTLASHLPGSAGNDLFPDDTAFKNGCC